MVRILLSIFLAAFGSSALAAENLALIIANKNYREFAIVRDAFEAADLNAALVDAGFEVRIIRNMSRRAMEQLAPVIRREIAVADRVLVFLAGHMFSSDRESWLMTTDAPRSDGLLAGTYGLAIGDVIDLMAPKAGSAVLLLGDGGAAQRLGDGLQYGYVARDIGQGVTVYAGRTGELTDLVRDGLLVAGNSTMAVAEQAPASVSAYGFLSGSVAFLSAPVADGGAPVDELELLIWDNARAVGTVVGISSYLDRYPTGRFAAEARQLLAALRKSPLQNARNVEQALNLRRTQRQEIQRDLSLLDYNTRGIDGIFGPGTRAAIKAWQGENDFAETGYLSGNQIGALDRAAAFRADELEEQARIRQLQQERQDAEFWRSTGRGGDETDLRAYLQRYPDGLYSEIAQDQLSTFDAARRRQAQAAEAQAWDEALDKNTAKKYNEFLKKFPDGVFADDARARLAVLQAGQSNFAAIAEERTVLSNPISRILVEQKLASLGFEPGRVDGRIDDKTRKALRKFQRAAGLPVSGHVTQATIVRLLAVR